MGTHIRNIEVLDDQVIAVLKAKKPQHRLEIAFNMWNFARKQLAAYLRDLHQDWSEEKIDKEVVRRLSHGAVC
ncbi:MAG: hypothetical protein FJW68_02070 [Actinobacteria bacterium]|nr:hypothetical protein [Actinomycetota bacterium]